MHTAATTRSVGIDPSAMQREQDAHDAALIPLVYSCSGCSSAAQMANDLALRLDRAGLAEMSCIAGVGGGIGSLVRTAQSGRPIITIDGCSLKCCQACLDGIDTTPDLALVLTRLGVPKVRHASYDPAQADRIHALLEREAGALGRNRTTAANAGSASD